MLSWRVKWYYSVENKPVGPVSRAELESLAEAGTITTSTLVVQEGMPDWFPFVNLKKTTQFLPAMAEAAAVESNGEFKG